MDKKIDNERINHQQDEPTIFQVLNEMDEILTNNFGFNKKGKSPSSPEE